MKNSMTDGWMARIWLGACAAMLMLPSPLSAQVEWVRKYDRSEYVEGFYSMNVSTQVRLISFSQAFDVPDQVENLVFQYEVPEKGTVELELFEKNILRYYRLESQPGKQAKGRYKLGPWPVGHLLKQYRISGSNLAVLMPLGEPAERRYLPVAVFADELERPSSGYQVAYRLSSSVSRGSISLYKGYHKGVIPPAMLVHRKPLGRYLNGATIEVEFEGEALGDYTGWVTVHANLNPRNRSKPITDRFYFYHQAK